MKISARILFTIVSLIIATSGYVHLFETSDNVEADEVLLIHNVYFYVNENVSEEEVEQFETGLEMLLNIPEIYKAELGIPAETEERDVTDHNFVYSIFTEFKTMDDYEIYAEHPDHMKFIEKYSHLWTDVKVYDSEIIFERE